MTTMADPKRHPHGCFQSFNGHPNQSQPQDRYHAANPGLHHFNSWSPAQSSSPGTPLWSYPASAPPAFFGQHRPTPPHYHQHHQSSNTHNHTGPYFGHSATASHAVHQSPMKQQQAPVPYTTAPTDICLATGKLCITVFKARDIKGDEWRQMGKADPYGVIKFGGKNVGGQAKTSVQGDAGSHPEWNQAFTFYVKRLDREYNEFCITLYNKNRARKDDVLGYFRETLLSCIADATATPLLDTPHKCTITLLGFCCLNFTVNEPASRPAYNLIQSNKLRTVCLRILAGKALQHKIMNLGQYIRENRNRVLENWYPVFLNGEQKGEILLAFDLIPMSPQEILNSSAAMVTTSVAPTISDPGRKYRISVVGNVIQVVLQGISILLPLLML